MKATFFDDSLPRFAALVSGAWGPTALQTNLFLRDVSGRLTFVVLDTSVPVVQRSALAQKAVEELGTYVDGQGFSVATPSELFDDRLSDLTAARVLHLKSPEFAGDVRLVDRRMVGADWLRAPARTADGPVRVVFGSLKGGVGRSTALCVVAAHLATRGRRVLTVDMDLEAPGLGNMLLPADTLPKFGLLDFLVEKNLGSIDDQFYADMVGSSWLSGGHGRVDVIPAIGQRSLDNPANVLGKLARAYLAGSVEDNSPGFAEHMSSLLDFFGDPLRYDAILVDVRAGLHETTAAAVVGLGAEVLLFGLDQPQTFAGYELMLAHLATLPISADDDWRDRLRFVHAKASENIEKRREFSDAMVALQQEYLWPSANVPSSGVDLASLRDTFTVEWTKEPIPIDIDDGPAPQAVSVILDDARFRAFNPLADRDSLSERAYLATYGDLLDDMVELVERSLKKRMPL